MPSPREQQPKPERKSRRQDSMPGGWLWIVVMLLLVVVVLDSLVRWSTGHKRPRPASSPSAEPVPEAAAL